MPELGTKNICYSIVTDRKFRIGMDVVIIVNAAVLATDRYPPQNILFTQMMERINGLCTIAFMGEVAMKTLGMGINFFADSSNLFDFALVLVSFIELIGLQGEQAMSALRTARLLRLVKIMKMQVSIQVLLRVLRRATVPTYNFVIVVLLCAYCFALLGLQILSDVTPTGDVLLHFHDFKGAFLTVFTLLSTEDWLKHMVAFASGSPYPVIVCLFFVANIVVSNLVLMNLFLGIFAAA